MTKPKTHTLFARIQNLTPEIEEAIYKAVRDGGGEFVGLKDGKLMAVEVENG